MLGQWFSERYFCGQGNARFRLSPVSAKGRLATLAVVSVWVKRELDSVAPPISYQNLGWYALRYRRALCADQLQTFRAVVARTRTPQVRAAQHAVDMKSSEPTVAAVVRQQTGVAWSRARGLCTEGRVTVNGQRCVDPALRVAPGTVVAVDQRAPKLRTGPLAESAIVLRPTSSSSTSRSGCSASPTNQGIRTRSSTTRTLLRQMGGHGGDAAGVVHRPTRTRAA